MTKHRQELQQMYKNVRRWQVESVMVSEVNTLQAWLRLRFLICKDGKSWALTGLALIYERLIIFKLSRLSLLLAHCRVSASFSTSFFEYEWAPLALYLLRVWGYSIIYQKVTWGFPPHASERESGHKSLLSSSLVRCMLLSGPESDHDTVSWKFIASLLRQARWLLYYFAVHLTLSCLGKISVAPRLLEFIQITAGYFILLNNCGDLSSVLHFCYLLYSPIFSSRMIHCAFWAELLGIGPWWSAPNVLQYCPAHKISFCNKAVTTNTSCDPKAEYNAIAGLLDQSHLIIRSIYKNFVELLNLLARILFQKTEFGWPKAWARSSLAWYRRTAPCWCWTTSFLYNTTLCTSKSRVIIPDKHGYHFQITRLFTHFQIYSPFQHLETGSSASRVQMSIECWMMGKPRCIADILNCHKILCMSKSM